MRTRLFCALMVMLTSALSLAAEHDRRAVPSPAGAASKKKNLTKVSKLPDLDITNVTVEDYYARVSVRNATTNNVSKWVQLVILHFVEKPRIFNLPGWSE